MFQVAIPELVCKGWDGTNQMCKKIYNLVKVMSDNDSYITGVSGEFVPALKHASLCREYSSLRLMKDY